MTKKSGTSGIKIIIIFVLSSLVNGCGTAGTAGTNQAATQPLPSPTQQSASPLPTATQETVGMDKNSPISTPRSPLSTSTPTPTEELITSEESLPGIEVLIDKAKEMLIQLPGSDTLAKDDISLKATERKQWRDSSLGCPRKGMNYNQVITAGYLILLEAEGKVYEFHTNTREAVVLCFIDGQDALEVLQP